MIAALLSSTSTRTRGLPAVRRRSRTHTASGRPGRTCHWRSPRCSPWLLRPGAASPRCPERSGKRRKSVQPSRRAAMPPAAHGSALDRLPAATGSIAKSARSERHVAADSACPCDPLSRQPPWPQRCWSRMSWKSSVTKIGSTSRASRGRRPEAVVGVPTWLHVVDLSSAVVRGSWPREAIFCTSEMRKMPHPHGEGGNPDGFPDDHGVHFARKSGCVVLLKDPSRPRDSGTPATTSKM
jgi:hypothetical protein